jgi:MFS family permease
VAALPSYASVGLLAPILLVVLRCLQGLSAGSEWAGSSSFLVEYAPRNRRALWGSVLTATAALLSDRIGRKPSMVLGSAGLALFAIPAFVVMSSGSVLGRGADLGVAEAAPMRSQRFTRTPVREPVHGA